MNTTRWALPFAVLLLSSCFQSFTLIKVNKDGSGTLEERFLLGNRFADMLRSLSDEDREGAQAAGEPEAAAAEGAPLDPQAVDIEKLKARAAKLGPGVELDLAEAARDGSGAGYRAVYRFADVNRLELRYNPAENVPALTEGQAPQQEPIRFRFTPGPTAALEILLPATAASGGQPAEPDDGTLHMLRQIYAEMKILLSVEVAGKIIETDADFQKGAVVTLLDLDFALLMQDDRAFRRVASAQPRSLEDLKRLASGNEVLRIEREQSVRVRFR